MPIFTSLYEVKVRASFSETEMGGGGRYTVPPAIQNVTAQIFLRTVWTFNLNIFNMSLKIHNKSNTLHIYLQIR